MRTTRTPVAVGATLALLAGQVGGAGTAAAVERPMIDGPVPAADGLDSDPLRLDGPCRTTAAILDPSQALVRIRSPRLTTPTNRPFSTMGSLRICCCAMSRAASDASISAVAAVTPEVISAFTAVPSGLLPAAMHRVTRSRSVTRPQMWPLLPHTGKKPMLYRLSSLAATAALSSGCTRIAGLVIMSRSFIVLPPKEYYKR